MLKQEVLGLGHTEIITFGLTQIDEQCLYLRRNEDNLCIVENPNSIDCQCPRKSLIPGILKTLRSNKSEQLPINIFELADVLLLENNKAINYRSLCMASMKVSSNFDELHGCLD